MLRGFDLGRPKAWPDANNSLNSTPYTEGLKALGSPDEIPGPPCG